MRYDLRSLKPIEAQETQALAHNSTIFGQLLSGWGDWETQAWESGVFLRPAEPSLPGGPVKSESPQ